MKRIFSLFYKAKFTLLILLFVQIDFCTISLGAAGTGGGGESVVVSSVSYTHNGTYSLSAGTTASLIIPKTTCINRTLKKATVLAKLSYGEPYNWGLSISGSSTTNVGIILYGYPSSGPAVQIGTRTLTINQANPEQWLISDFTANYNSFTRIEVVIIPNSYTAPSTQLLNSVKFDVTCNLETEVSNLGLSPLTISFGGNAQVRNDDKFEQLFQWTACKDVPGYQLQILRLFADQTYDPGSGSYIPDQSKITELDWNRALLLEVEGYTTSNTIQKEVTLAEGTGCYIWRVRAIGNLPNGVANPNNLGEWFGYKPYVDVNNYFNYTQKNENFNWIYSRRFSEGSRVSEKLMFSNGLQRTRQTQTRIFSNNKQVITSQTLQDYAGRDALQSLPVPVNGDRNLGFKSSFFKKAGTAIEYSTTDFDHDAYYDQPLPADEGGYYSGTGSPGSYNAWVPNAELFPFTRTRFTTDGTNRVVEQGGAGGTFRIKKNDSKTIRTYYTGVAEAELVRLFGKEAPYANGVQKTLTIDPNKVTTVTYQTKDGQTIATALSAGSRPTEDSTMQTVNTGSPTLITETITDRLPFNGTGTATRKELTVTERTYVTVGFKIKPDLLNDDCSNICTTCDYKVEIYRHTLSNPAPTALVPKKSFILKPKSCIGFDTTGTFIDTLETGSYVYEQRITAYNTDGNQVAFLDKQINILRAEYNDKFTSGDWVQINTLLRNKDLDGLYAFLEGNGYSVNGGFEVPIACSNNITEFIRIPFIDACPEDNCDPKYFEDLFYQQWGDSSSYVDKNSKGIFAFTNYSRDYSNFQSGQFDKMITNMLADGYECSELWACWQGIVLSYDSQVKSFGGVNNVDILADFLNCVDSKIIEREPSSFGINKEYFYDKASVSPSNEYAYKEFFFDENNPQHRDCMEQLGSEQDPHGNNFMDYSEEERKNIYLCVTNSQPSNPNQSPEEITLEFAEEAMAQCRQACEDRRYQFVDAIVAAFHRKEIYVEGDQYTLVTEPGTGIITATGVPIAATGQPITRDDLEEAGFEYVEMCQVLIMAEALVKKCKEGNCDLEIIYNEHGEVAGFGDPNNSEALQQALFAGFDVDVARQGEGCDYEPVDLPDQLIQVKATSCAVQLIEYTNALVQTANKVNYIPGRKQLPCPDIHQVGEIETLGRDMGLFAYYGSLSTSCNRIGYGANTPNCQDEPSRTNYWISVLDDRRDFSISNNNPYDPIGYEWQNNEFRVIWGFRDDPDYKVKYNGSDFDTFIDPSCRVTLTNGVENGVPYLLRGSDCERNYDYSIKFYYWEAGSKVYVNKQEIVSMSPLKLEPEPVSAPASYFDEYSPEFLSTLITLSINNKLNVKKCFIEVETSAPSPNRWMRWKEVDQSCVNDGQFELCFQWGVMPGEIIAADLDSGMVDYYPMPTCNDNRYQQVKNQIAMQVDSTIDARVKAFRDQYTNVCVKQPNLDAHLQLNYNLGYYHYTLYYYDRAGNLIKTVPPAGVAEIPASQLSNTQQIATVRNQVTGTIPSHTKATRYYYNSLKQLVQQQTPDGGTTDFIYNRQGQLRFSRNAKQKVNITYSYTKYDKLGRVIEVGESNNYTSDIANKAELANFPSGSGRWQITKTVYSTPSSMVYPAQIGAPARPQRYLTNRVSYTYLDVDGDSANTNDQVVTYYSYDPHGNVEWMVQSIPGMDKPMYLRYEYELVSGKVKKVYFNEGYEDALFHKYEYDEDNRIKEVYTSANGYLWERDASYTYYAHGPLKRAEIGKDKVQGIDYTYTLQGWLKAINHPSIDPTKDPGGDGTLTGADAFGMMLGYYNNDYLSSNAHFASNSNTYLGPGVHALYNGNISSWTTRTLNNPNDINGLDNLTGEQYVYDELNRLVRSEFYTHNSTNWNAPIGEYRTRYTYDPDGNIKTLQRNGHIQLGGAMDRLTYTYDGGTNRLNHVTDQVGNNNYDDIESQAWNNYGYDEVGNLIRDNQSSITNIRWTPYGKVEKIEKANGLSYTFRYDAAGNRVAKIFNDATKGLTDYTFYARDASGNIMAVYDKPNGQSVVRAEAPIYGSDRLGVYKGTPQVTMSTPTSNSVLITRKIGYKRYELKDHLGNVRAVVNDYKVPIISGTTIIASKPKLEDYFNYYAFGMLMPGRYWRGDGTNNGGYRYGFNGKEKLNNGELGLTHYDFDARIYNPALGRWLSLDPSQAKYPGWNPYNFSFNSPLAFKDPDGKDPVTAIFEGVVAFGIEAGLDFMTNLVVNGQDANTAFNNIDWASASYEGAKATAMSVLAPSGLQTAARLAKVGNTKIGKLTTEFVVNLTNEAMSNIASGQYNDVNGNFSSELLSADFENLAYSAAISTLVGAGMGDKADDLFKSLKKSNGKLAKQYEKLYKNLDSPGSTKMTLDNRMKKVNGAAKDVLSTGGKAAVVKAKEETISNVAEGAAGAAVDKVRGVDEK